MTIGQDGGVSYIDQDPVGDARPARHGRLPRAREVLQRGRPAAHRRLAVAPVGELRRADGRHAEHERLRPDERRHARDENVDLATQFTTMITAQRGFQANSRVISTADEMLQDLVNLKR